MSNLRKLYDEFIAKRLAWPTIRRDAEEALLKAIVDELEAMKGSPIHSVDPAELIEVAPKRGPGRPPKAEAA